MISITCILWKGWWHVLFVYDEWLLTSIACILTLAADIYYLYAKTVAEDIYHLYTMTNGWWHLLFVYKKKWVMTSPTCMVRQWLMTSITCIIWWISDHIFTLLFLMADDIYHLHNMTSIWSHFHFTIPNGWWHLSLVYYENDWWHPLFV